MDLSVQKMQPPATTKGKTAAKKSDPNGSEEAAEAIARDQKVYMGKGNAGYEERDHDEERQPVLDDRKARRKNRQMLSSEDLTQLTSSLLSAQQDQSAADELMNLRAYKSQADTDSDEDKPHFELNI